MQNKDFICYEYKTVSAKPKDQTKVADMYEAFGWEITDASLNATGTVTLSLKRDRKQKHKQELTKLERQAESTYDVIDKLNSSKTRGAQIFSMIFGVIATLIFGGGLSLTLATPQSTVPLVIGIILGVIGIALCGVNYILYKKIADKKTKQLLPIIDDNEEKLANLLEKGNDLLKAEII